MARKDWIRVTKKTPCRVCKRPDWCIFHVDGSVVICARVMSDRMVGKKGAGWLHRMNGQPIPRYEKRDDKPDPPRDWAAFAEQCQSDLPEQDALADELKLDCAALHRLMMGWSRDFNCYTFPMRDGIGNIVGIRTRYRSGHKAAIKGSSSGLFIPLYLPDDGDIWVCEGPTDTAAMLSVGLLAIGRPSNTGGLIELVATLKRRKRCTIHIFADRDEAGSEAERLTIHGAQTLAIELAKANRRCKIVRPPQHKDCRDMTTDGAGSAVFMSLANNTDYFA